MALNIAQQDSQIKRLPDDLLRQMLMQMTQSGQVGTPEYILAAGEIQARNDARQKAMAGQGNPTPVISDLLAGGAMPMAPQGPMAPEDAGGIAALPAPNMDNINAMAAGGLVAFENGGSTFRSFDTTRRILEELGLMDKEGRYVRPYKTAREKRLVEEQQARLATDRAGDMSQLRQVDNAGLAALGQAQADAGTAPPPTAAPGAAPPAGDRPTVTRVDQPPAAAPAAPGVNYQGAFNQAMGFAKQLVPDQPAPTTPEPNAKDLIKERQQLYKDLGIEDPTKMRRDQLTQEMKDAKSEKEQAGWMRLAEFGFNWASQNGPALQAAAKAGAAVTPGLISDVKDLNKLDRERQKELAGLAALNAQAQRATADSVLAEIQRKRERAEDRLDKVETQRNTIAAALAGNVITSQTSLQTTKMTTDATLARLAESLAETESKNIIDAAMNMVTKDMNYATMTDEQKEEAFRRAVRTVKQLRRSAGTSVTPSGT